jgi:hypothetical protein
MFGLTNSEGNHGEDVKEYYFYLDSTPTHSYMKYLYKYPQRAFPYTDLVNTNRERTRDQMEYELLDTGVFDENRYFDIFVEYAKGAPEDILVRITACNRGKDSAALHLLPTLWFRNTWEDLPEHKPELGADDSSVLAHERTLGVYRLECDGQPPLLFTDNETNPRRIPGTIARSRYFKDGINDFVVHGDQQATNPAKTGTKASAHYSVVIPGEGEVVVRLRLHAGDQAESFSAFDPVFSSRIREADEFYSTVIVPGLSSDQSMVMRQALAGMLWSKQFYYFDLDKWLAQHGYDEKSDIAQQGNLRNINWFHMLNKDVISMPDKWEYPWYAAWDLGFHTIPLALVDLDFAKSQLQMILRSMYLHPNGQIPAYEWNFSDVNPPVHAWAVMTLNAIEMQTRGKPDIGFLKDAFHKLLLNFTWWVNRKDPLGNNLFEGGFLGLDNIGVFDRSATLPAGACLEQADGTAWMAFYCLTMLEIALELAKYEELYAEMALKFGEHFLWIASAMDKVGNEDDTLWDEKDGFFYDILRTPGGKTKRLNVRSMVGLLALCATAVLEEDDLERHPLLLASAQKFLARHPDVMENIALPNKPGFANRRLLAVMNEDKLRRVLARVLDEKEFLSPHGLRSLSKQYEHEPFHIELGGKHFAVSYLPAESNTGMFGGNSNWRGPVWFPVNLLILRALHQFYLYFGNDFKIECPTGSGRLMTLFDVSQEIVRRLCSAFERGLDGRRPVHGGAARFQNDPHWRDLILFYEYFHGDNGAGLGASHQTGWTGTVARLFQLMALSPEIVLTTSGPAEALAETLSRKN